MANNKMNRPFIFQYNLKKKLKYKHIFIDFNSIIHSKSVEFLDELNKTYSLSDSINIIF